MRVEPRRGSIVVVTGASAGLGRAIAEAFADVGADVAVVARDSDRLRDVRNEIEARGCRSMDVALDVSDHEALDRAADQVESELGPIDVWVNNAMVSVFAPVPEISARDFARVTEVTYLGYVYGTMAALRRMRPRDRGTIVQIGSALAYRAIPLQSAYCGAKHAIEGFTESLRCELLHEKSGVSVTMVQMPALNTPQFHWVKTDLDKHPQPVPPIFDPHAAARAVLHAASTPRREYWYGGPTARAILANRVIPGLLDRYLGRYGVDSQKADFATEPSRPNNLYDPVPGDFGARGEFTSKQRTTSVQWWLSVHRRALLSAGALAAAAAWGGTKRRSG
ncbi:MAG: SDR family oxidoreductase [Actinobacteria bacterium]|nr:SDR family oxidoreductase [Actinomycetota bacterium]